MLLYETLVNRLTALVFAIEFIVGVHNMQKTQQILFV